MNTAFLQEVFSSVQGEGVYLGVRQIFIRFQRCNLACIYCDTNEATGKLNENFRVEIVPGSGDFQWLSNPVTPRQLLDLVETMSAERHHSLSLTGGEPLLYKEFLLEFLKLFHGTCPVFLETNGTRWEDLKEFIPLIDIVSMDFKLPSATGLSSWDRHGKFLKIAKEKEVYVKIVLTSKTEREEIDQAVKLIQKIDNGIPLILQPVTPVKKAKGISPRDVISIQDYCSRHLKNVRVIPQMHKTFQLL